MGATTLSRGICQKLDEALEEAMETQSWLDHALDCKYISATQFAALDANWQSIGGMLNSMMNRADDFCKFAPSADQRKPFTNH